MCTIVVASHHYEDAKLAVAANHDAVLDENPTRFGIWENRSPTALGPICEITGSTWMGLNEYGVFAALTNRMAGYPNKGLRTRGQLIFRAIRSRSAEEARDNLMEMDAADFNPFHMVFADLDTCLAIWTDGHQIHKEDLGHGLHIITERSFGAGDDPRAEWVLDKARGTQSVADLADVLCVQREPALAGPCVHIPSAGFGTSESCIFEFHDQRGLGIMYADGPPNQVDYTDYSAQINALVAIPIRR